MTVQQWAEREGLAGVPRWTPVAEGLPQEGVWVLVATRSFLTAYRTMRVAQRYTGGRWIDDGCDWIETPDVKVTHWMPLPEPPREATT